MSSDRTVIVLTARGTAWIGKRVHELPAAPVWLTDARRTAPSLHDHCTRWTVVGEPVSSVVIHDVVETIPFGADEVTITVTTELPAVTPGAVGDADAIRRKALVLAEGCHDYGGGYSGAEYDAFQDGIATVANVLRAWAMGREDSQMAAVRRVGEERIGAGE